MGNIHIMDEFLSNKIAAGEVVERPASVVKELVENAIDAKSTTVEVFLEDAGLQSIQVIDNGTGMDEEDAFVAFARHATSKILKEQDLFRIRTLGFRGEALASIASVSKVTIKTSDGVSGVKLRMEGGHVVEHVGADLRRGTDLTIAQLFYNTPARLKYLKTVQTELGHSIDLMNRLALCYPNIAFKLVHNGQTLLHTNGRGNVQQVLASIYGMHNAKKMFAFEGESKDYKIHGFATMPEITRASKNYMSIFVNGRWVKHYLVQKVVVDAYHTFLPIGRFPIIALYIEGDPQLTDVNVHPAKHEIRLSKEPELLALIEQTIRQKLATMMHVPVVEKKQKAPKLPSEQMNIWKATAPTLDEQKLTQVVERLNEAPPTRTYDTQSNTVFERPQAVSSQAKEMSEQTPIASNEVPNVTAPVDLQQQAPHYTEPFTMKDELYEDEEVEDVDILLEEEAPRKEHFPAVEIVGQIHGTYIVAQMEDGFYLIDQHAAQERIKYEYFRDKVGEVNPNERQAMLLPLTFHYSQDETLALQENLQALADVGIYLEEFGHGSFVVREHPTWFPKGFEQEIIEELIEQVLATRRTDVKKLREEAAIMMSCKKSIKANYYLTKEQMERLLDDLRQCETPFTCPHGRPVLIHFTSYEVEKMFKRVM